MSLKRVLIYCRVSSPKQAKEDRYSLPTQEKEVREYLAKTGGYKVVVVEYEEGVSAHRFDRPAMERVLSRAENGEIDVVACAKVDRLARGRIVDAMLEAALSECGVDIIYINRDTSTPEGRLLVNIEKDFAEWERERIIERTSKGKLASARAGKVPGHRFVPYGYTKTPDQ